MLLAATLGHPCGAAGAEFCLQMVTLVIFLLSLHSIVWGKEEMHSEEERGLEDIGQYWRRTAPGAQNCLYNH